MFGRETILNKIPAGGGGCTDIVDNYDPFGGDGIALYQLNGNANDVSGNYNGTATSVTYGTGVFGQAGVFNGSSSYINTNLSLPFNGVKTISMWFKANSLQNAVLFEAGPNIAFYGYALVTVNDGRFYFIINNSAHSAFIGAYTTGATYAANTWYNVVSTQTASVQKTYLNGVEIGTVSYSTTSESYPIYLAGGSPSGFSGLLNGSIDQVRIFNTALDPLEVEALYIEELCVCDGTVDTLQVLGDSSCIATYQLDGNANDLSGNYSGTPTAVSYGVGEFDLAGVYTPALSQIVLPDLQGLFTSKTTSTVSLWFNSNSTATNNQWLFADYSSTSFNYLVYLNTPSAGKIRLMSRYSSVTTSTDSVSTGLNDGNWHHLVVMVDITNLKHRIYIDGSFEIEGNLPSNAYNGSSPVTYLGGYNLDGSIDQVRIFNKALSAGEVTTLYNETACTKVCTSGTTNTLQILGDSSCVAAYPLDGSPLDLSGNYNGVQTNVTYTQGEFDLAGVFNGTNSGIGLPNNFLPTNLICSGSFWVKGTSLTNTTSLTKVIFANVYGSYLAFTVYNGYLEFKIKNSSNADTDAKYSVSNFNANDWFHLVFVANGLNGQMVLYVNGVSVATATAPSSFRTLALYNSIGCAQPLTSPESPFNGSIDQVRIFNKALSAGEVTTLYNETPCN